MMMNLVKKKQKSKPAVVSRLSVSMEALLIGSKHNDTLSKTRSILSY